MKFKIGENLPIEVAELLEDAGYDAFSIWDQKMAGCDDPAVAKVCQNEGRCLITLDKGVADIRTYPPENFAGLMILRVKTQDKSTILALIKKMFISHACLSCSYS